MEGKATRRTAVVAGATGLVGAELVRRLLAQRAYRRIVALSRRPLDPDAKLAVVDAGYDRLDSVLADTMRGEDPLDVFCCLGTTIRRAGSQEAFRRVDHDFVIALGQWARNSHARRFVVVSAAGADPSSRVFYNRVKGEMERDLQSLRLRSLVIVRPSLLSGDRAEFRLGERFALAVTRPLRTLIPAGVRPIAAADVAQSMIDAALSADPPSVIESAAMQGTAHPA
jgi:uncharacterized protein YbjT (DUF2867 family)